MPEELVYVDMAGANKALGRPARPMLHGGRHGGQYGVGADIIAPVQQLVDAGAAVRLHEAKGPSAAPITQKRPTYSGSDDVIDHRRIVDVIADSTIGVLGDSTSAVSGQLLEACAQSDRPSRSR